MQFMCKSWTGLIFWVLNSPSTTVSRHMTLQSSRIVSQTEDYIQSRGLPGHPVVTIMWPPYLMSSTFCVPEALGECTAPCIGSPSLQFRKVAPPQLQWHLQNAKRINFLSQRIQKERTHSLSLAPTVLLRHQNPSKTREIHWFWKIKLLDGMSSCNAGAWISKDVLQWPP